MTSPLILATLAIPLVWGAAPSAAEQADTAVLLATIKQVAPQARGHLAAQAAWQKMARLPADQIPVLLSGLDDAGPLSANWIRSAIDTIAERQRQAGGKLPATELEAVLSERRHAPRARRLAYDLLLEADASAAERWLPKMLDDPSLELRREAVARVIDDAQKKGAAGDPDQAKAQYQAAITAARDIDQINAIAAELKKLGAAPDLSRLFGFVTEWKVVGPFDNVGGKGYATAYPPEQEPGQAIDPAAQFDSKSGRVGWQDAQATDEFGHVDLNRALVKEKGVVGYAYAEFRSKEARPVELRLGTDNAPQVWLNGKLVIDAEVYHSSTAMDQYVGRGTLEPGVNRILVKLCQNEQTQEWAGDWQFQLRLCDEIGSAVLPEEKP